jgi:hypothetical protein
MPKKSGMDKMDFGKPILAHAHLPNTSKDKTLFYVCSLLKVLMQLETNGGRLAGSMNKMEMTSGRKPRLSKIQLATVIIALLSLVVAFTGVKFQDITSYISVSLSPRADYTIRSSATPSYISSDYGQSLLVSTEYIIITNVGLSSDTFYQANPMRFSVSFEDKGKKAVEQPNILILIVDPLYRIWGVWNKSATNDELTHGWSFDYHFPPLDQKIIGTWVIITHLYDDATASPVLISYEFRMFRVTDEAPSSWELGVLVSTAIATVGTIALFYVDRRMNRARKKLESEIESKKRKSSQPISE